MEYTINEEHLPDNFYSCLLNICDKYGSRGAIRFGREGIDTTVSYESMGNRVLSLMKVMKEEYKEVNHVALIGPFNYEWIIAFFALVSSNITVIPIDFCLSMDDIMDTIKDGDVTMACLTGPMKKGLCEALHRQSIITLDAKEIDVYCEKYSIVDRELFDTPRKDDIAMICYTSGTTGKSKGVMLSQQNIVYNVYASAAASKSYDFSQCNSMPVLPPHHMFQVTAGFLVPLVCGMTLCLINGIKDFSDGLKKYRPPILYLVPAIAENMYKQLVNRVKQGKLGQNYERVKQFSNQMMEEGVDLRRELFCSFRDVFGYNLQRVICGGAMLDISIVELFNDVGIQILNGYGITEASPVLTCNRIHNPDNRTVGIPLPLCELQIMNGEICARGPMIFKGYYKRKEETEEAFEDGWFKTGDLGCIDSNGNVVIKGRKKNLIILKDGNNISPEELEDKLLKIKGVEDGMVLARTINGNDVLTFLVYLESNGNTEECERIQEKIKQSVSEVNRQWPFYKQIQNVEFTDKKFEKTALGKNKRYLLK